MLRCRRVALALLALLILPASGWAAETAAPPPGAEAEGVDFESGDLPPVVISATRVEQPAFDSARSVEVIAQPELSERQPRTVPEVLRESAGAFVQQTNFGGGSPIVRGMVGPQVLILVDGVRLNNSVYRTGPLQYLNLLDSFQIERLELMRGPGSVAYGSDALGGVIQAVMFAPTDRRGDAGWDATVGGRYGTAAREKTVHGSVDGGAGGLSALASASFRDFYDLQGGRGIGEQPYTSYSQLNASARVEYRPAATAFRDWRFAVSGMAARMSDVGRGEGLVPKHRASVYQNADDLLYARAEIPIKALATETRLTVSYQRFDEEKLDRHFDAGNAVVTKEGRNLVTVHTLGLDAQLTTRLLGDRLTLAYGGSYYRDAIDSKTQSHAAGESWATEALPPYPEGASYELGSGWLLASSELLPLAWDWRLGVSGGYRAQLMAGHAGARGDGPAFDFSSLAHVFQAGLETGYHDAWKGALTWSQGFRAPNSQESLLVGDTGDWFNAPNKELGPERADTFEAMTRFDAWRLYGSAAGYVTLISDCIRRVPTTWLGQTEIDGNLVVHNANGGDARIYGTEASLGMRLGWGWSLEGSLAWTQGDELLDAEARAADPTGRDSIPLSKIPPLFGSARLRWSGVLARDLSAFVETSLLWAGKQDRLSDLDLTDVRIPADGTPGWVAWNLRGGLTVYEGVRAMLSVENVTNAAYKYHVSGFHMPGTNVLMGLEATL